MPVRKLTEESVEYSEEENDVSEKEDKGFEFMKKSGDSKSEESDEESNYDRYQKSTPKSASPIRSNKQQSPTRSRFNENTYSQYNQSSFQRARQSEAQKPGELKRPGELRKPGAPVRSTGRPTPSPRPGNSSLGKNSKLNASKSKRNLYYSDSDEEENDSDSDEFLLFTKEWRSKSRRERRFTKDTLHQLHERAEEVLKNQKLREEEREKRLQEMTDVLDEMDDYIMEYKQRKDQELTDLTAEKLLADDPNANLNIKISANAWKKFPAPGSNPKVTFKPEKFEIKQGFLYKKGLKWTHWNKRFFKIYLDDPHNLYYYSSMKAAEKDSLLTKPNRNGKKINLLFAHVDSITSYNKMHKRVHKNKNILRDFEFFVQTKTVKKINGKNKQVLGRVFFLCALSEVETTAWLRTLSYVEHQTEKCIKEHNEKIQQGIKLKKAYFDSLKQAKQPVTASKQAKDEKPDEEVIDAEQLRKWDRAQMISAYGTGLAEAIAGQKAKFIIQDNYHFKDHPAKRDPKTRLSNSIKERFNEELLTVVLETNELHYDLEIIPLNPAVNEVKSRFAPQPKAKIYEDPKFLCEFLPTRRGEYELSVLYDGVDIYGSPFKVRVEPGPVSAAHCFLSGPNYLVVEPNQAPLEHHLFLNVRNAFDEKVFFTSVAPNGEVDEDRIREIEVQVTDGIEITNMEQLKKIVAGVEPVLNETGSVKVEYKVDIEKLKSAQSPQVLSSATESHSLNQMYTAEIRIRINDQINTPSFFKAVKNSPFILNVLASNNLPTKEQQPMPAQESAQNDKSFIELPLPDSNHRQSQQTPVHQTQGYGAYFAANTPQPSFMQFQRQTVHQAPPNERSQQYFKQNLFQQQGQQSTQQYYEQNVERGHDTSFKSVSPTPSPMRSPPRKPGSIGKEQIPFQNNVDTSFVGSVGEKDLDETVNFRAEEFDRRLLRLFEQHETVLRTVFNHYKQNDDDAISIHGVIKLGIDYDIIPTFISKREVRSLFAKLPQTQYGSIEFEWFLVCLAEIAIHSLSKPMFTHLYSSDKSKVNVLLNMWGLGDAAKISGIRQNQNFNDDRDRDDIFS